MSRLVLFVIATLWCCVYAANTVSITYGIYSDSACTTVVSTSVFTSGNCSYDSSSGYSAILTVQGDLLTDNYYASMDCTGTGQTTLFANNVCNSQGNGKYMKFSYTYQDPSDTSTITYTHYSDTTCTTSDSSGTYEPGKCAENGNGFSAILLVQGDVISDNYFLGTGCIGAGATVTVDKDTCTPDGGTGSFIMTWGAGSVMVPNFVMLLVGILAISFI